ncbi:MAG TPA: glycosyltransferase [Steroidobacteraceae bacterium]|jgi:glycosyltransferase involved in cell wall biosynthesis
MTRALRVLHIASGDLWAGAEVQAFTLIAHLAQMPDTQIAAVLMNDRALADKLRSIGISTYILDEQMSHSLEIFVQLRRVLRSWRPDIVHTHRQKENILGSLANRSCANVPSVRTVHGANEIDCAPSWTGVRRRVVANLDRWCGRALQQRLIAVTPALGAQMTGEFPAAKIAVIENGVDSATVRSENGVAAYRATDPDATHIGIAGRLVEVKRVDLYIEMAAILLRERPERNWRFHIFGEGPMRRSLEGLSQRLQTHEKVIFHGHRQDIATCVGGLDALVICSDHEGMPMISLEAAALGVPVVAHAVGGLPNVVPEEFLVTRHEPSGYSSGILRVLRADGRAIAARSAVAALNQFSAQRNAEKVRALYESLIGSQ